MDAPVGSRPASELPKSMSNILDILMKEMVCSHGRYLARKWGVSLRLKWSLGKLKMEVSQSHGETKGYTQKKKIYRRKTAYSKTNRHLKQEGMRRDPRKGE